MYNIRNFILFPIPIEKYYLYLKTHFLDAVEYSPRGCSNSKQCPGNPRVSAN